MNDLIKTFIKNTLEECDAEAINKLVSKLKNLDELKEIDKSKGYNEFIKDICTNNFTDDEKNMINKLILSSSNPIMYLKNQKDILSKIIVLLKDEGIIELYKKCIEEMNKIDNPSFNDYEDFIEYSLIIFTNLSSDNGAKLQKGNKNYLEILLRILCCGLRYAGEGKKGLSYNGIQKIKQYSKDVPEEWLKEILTHICYKDSHIIRYNNNSIRTLIDSCLENKNNSNKSFVKFFYLDTYWISEYISEYLYDYIDKLNEFENYQYSNNTDKIYRDANQIKRILMNKKETVSETQLVVEEIKDLKNKNFIFDVKQMDKFDNKIKSIIEIKFNFINEKQGIECQISNISLNKKIYKTKYNYNEEGYRIFGGINNKNLEKHFVTLRDITDEIDKYSETDDDYDGTVEILYLYIKNMHGKENKNFELNFYNNYEITSTEEKNKIILNVEYKKDIKSTNDFYYITNEKNHILSINAILGKNGDGKTSILKLLYNIKLDEEINKKFPNETKFCLITKIKNNIYWTHNFDNDSIDVIVKDDILKPICINSDYQYNKIINTDVIYFSNIVNLNDMALNDRITIDKMRKTDLTSQYVYNYEKKNIYGSDINNENIKLIEFSLNYDKKYRKLIAEEYGNDLDIKIIENVYIEVFDLREVEDNLISKLKKYNFTEELVFNSDEIYRILDSIGIRKREKYSIFIWVRGLIFNYYTVEKYKSIIKSTDFEIKEDDVVWNVVKLIKEIDSKDIDGLTLRLNLNKHYEIIFELNKIINKYRQQDMNFICYQISDISSGEIARLSLFSRLDWLWNNQKLTVDFAEENERKSYILILDEVEALFHPEWQRKFIYDLITFLEFEYSRDAYKNIQVIVSSNSPFFISDLPKGAIQFLNKTYEIKPIGGFGQNIYEIMNTAFGMQQGLIGEFAKFKINKVLNLLMKDESISNKELAFVNRVIEYVEEPIIKNRLIDMYRRKLEKGNEDNKYNSIQNIARRLQELEQNKTSENNDEIENLKKQLKELIDF